ncbi:hypothetical protein ACFO3O_02985 [Dokdonia ponticola]|uniref:Lipoprotein n=1 Tax=Dokdonia ponticola TaxID=2041041 RepID=A0ABV9HTN9_9FLAO
MRLLHYIVVFIGLGMLTSCTPSLADMYGKEISNLRTQEEIDAYWKELERIDQKVLLDERDIATYDSISISNMIRVALLFEVPGKESYLQKGAVPVVALSHNFNKDAHLAYWPVIVKCAEMKGVIHDIGYPSYPLESFAYVFYDYSVFGQEERYPYLVEKLNKSTGGFVISQLEVAFKQAKKLRQLTEENIIGSWFIESIKGEKGKRTFEFIKMSDAAVYKKSRGRLQKLIQSGTDSKIYTIEKDPFGWYYELSDSGDLRLFDQNDMELITYTKVIK